MKTFLKIDYERELAQNILRAVDRTGLSAALAGVRSKHRVCVQMHISQGAQQR
jgi:hypothetical protein